MRACRNRVLVDGQTLFAAMGALPAGFGYAVAVPARPGRPARVARLVVRWGAVILPRPQRSREAAAEQPVWALDVAEIASSEVPKRERIRWRLLTHEVSEAAQALQVLAWCRQRWHIEQLFRLLKTQGWILRPVKWKARRACARWP